MAAVSIDKFFRLLDLYETNRYVDTYKSFQDAATRMMEEYPSTNLYNEVLKLNTINNFSLVKDRNIISTALQARQKTRKFFIRTMIPGSYAFNTKDMDLFREWIVDWASAIKTQKDLMRQCTDAFALDDEDVDKAIKGFGIDWVNKKSQPQLMTAARARFLYAICELYKIKGSPQSIIKALGYLGIANAIVKEHWVEKVPFINNQLEIRAVATSKYLQKFNPDTNSYNLTYKGSADDVIIPWDSFLDKMQEIADPHWWYKHDEIVDIDNDPDTWLKLQSLTPYFGIVSYNDLNKYNLTISFLEKILDDQFNQFLHGDKDYIPQEIGLDGFNQETTQRKIQIDGYSKPLTLIEAYLAYSYCQIRYDEFMAFTKLKDFMLQHQVNIDMTYKYPYGYLNLIYELWLQRNDYVNDTPVTIDMILKQYPGDLSHYYLSNNELKKWWESVRPSTTPSAPVPEIFYSNNYQFRFIRNTTDTTYDKILHYNGNRDLDYRKSTFQYDEALGDFARDANQTLHRGTEYDDLKSYYPSNATVNNDKKMGDYLFDHIATYFRNISEYTKEYTENYEHDGSSLTPEYIAKWPETKSWNWAIDKWFYYMSYTPTKWSRWSIETNWSREDEKVYIAPNSGPVYVTFVGESIYYNQYVYAYASTNKWVRWVVETDWSYCSGPIRPDGSFRTDNDFSKQFIVGQIDKNITYKYLNNNLEQGIDRVSLTIDPYEIRSAKKNVTLSVNEFKDYLTALDAHVDVTGNLIKNVTNFKHDQFIYSYVYDIVTETKRWVRKPCETEWDYNGAAVYQGGYHFPGLDLTDRYDAERILRGEYIVSIDDLMALPIDEIISYFISNNDNKILVCRPNMESPNELDRYPRSYQLTSGQWVGKWKEKTRYHQNDVVYTYLNGKNRIYVAKRTVPSTISRPIDITNETYWEEITDPSDKWVPTAENELDKIQLGFNDDIMQWIDGVRCTEESMYGDLADEILAVTSNYVSIQFQDSELNIAGIYKDIANKGLYHDAIEFYKPKRARLLYFSVEFSIDTKIDNSLFLEDVPENSKIIHEIQDHVPRNDLIYLNNQNREQDGSKVRNEALYINPENSQYVETLPDVSQYEYYIGDCPHQFVNGFYKKIKNQDGTEYWINDHNVVIQRISNPTPIWSGKYYAEWIIARRKITGLSRCDAWYLNYINDATQNFDDPATENQKWFVRKDDPDSEEPAPFKIIKIANVSLNTVNREHRVSTALALHRDYSDYDVKSIEDQSTQHINLNTDNEISWNTIFPRDNSLVTETKGFSLDQREVDPAYCVDDIRPLYPRDNQLAGVPESFSGGRYDNADYDQSQFDKYNKEYRHDYRDKDGYPYVDQLIISDAPSTEFEQVQIRSLTDSTNNLHNEVQAITDYTVTQFIVGKIGPGVTSVKSDKLKSLYINGNFKSIAQMRACSIVYLRRYKVYNGSVAINSKTGIPDGFMPSLYQYTLGAPTGQIVFNASSLTEEYEVLFVCRQPGYWWLNDKLDWYSGPGHRPAYIGVQDSEEDPYPCHDWADCCDYYDTGCRHDGPTNPHVEIWQTFGEDGQWTECDTAHGHLIDSDFDEWTHYHKEVGYIDKIPECPDPTHPEYNPRQQALDHYISETIHGRLLEDPGDTYCNECGVPAISPDQTTRNLPEILKSCGVYHESLRNDSRTTTKYYRTVNYWTCWDNNKPYEVVKDSNNNYFDYGYVSSDKKYQLRHAFNKPTATHRWEVTTTTEPPEIQYVTKSRPFAHTEEELDGQPFTWVSRPDAFVEGTEFDVAEDSFLDTQGNECGLFFTNNTIVSLPIKKSTINLPFNVDLWTLVYKYNDLDNKHYVYINTPSGWKQINKEAVIPSEDNAPSDENNYFGYWLRKQESSEKYDLYLYVSCEERIGWVVIRGVSMTNHLNNCEGVYNNDWVVRSNTIYKICHMKLEDPDYDLSDETHYCADPINYAETYDGAMLAITGKNRTRCTVREKVFNNIYDYCTTTWNYYRIVDSDEVYYRKIWNSESNYTIRFLKLDITHPNDAPSGWQFCDSLKYRRLSPKFVKVEGEVNSIYQVSDSGNYWCFEAIES